MGTVSLVPFLTAMYLYILDIATDFSFLIIMSVLVCTEVDRVFVVW